MAQFIGSIVGLGAGLCLSVFFIFPSDILSLKLVNMTIGDILRILGGLVVTLVGGGIGWAIGAFIDESDNDPNLEAIRKRVEKEGGIGSHERTAEYLKDMKKKS